jgi:hypothetical protein
VILHTAPQGSPEWHQARAGCITGSMFATAREKLKSGANKGQPSAAAGDYAFRLAVERISGKPLDEGFETWAMRRGHELEPAARFDHEMAIGVVVEPVGFITTDDGKFGASADGFIGQDGGAEYKCLVDPSRLRKVLLTGDISEFLDQIQGGMWITGRKWWDFCLYCPALESIGLQLWHRRVERDDNYIEQLEVDLIGFEKLVSQNEDSLRSYREAA